MDPFEAAVADRRRRSVYEQAIAERNLRVALASQDPFERAAAERQLRVMRTREPLSWRDKPAILSGGPLQTAVELAAFPWSVAPSLVGAMGEQLEKGEDLGLLPLSGRVLKGTAQRIGHGYYGQDMLHEAAPEWSAEHPTAAGLAGFGFDIAAGGPMAKLQGAGLRIAGRPIGAGARAAWRGAQRIPKVGAVAETAPRGVGDIERSARRLMDEADVATARTTGKLKRLNRGVDYTQRKIESSFEETLAEAERGTPRAVDEIRRRARTVSSELTRARAEATRLEGEAARAVELAGQGEQRGVIRARQRFVDARRAEARATARYAEVGRDYVRAQREHMELVFGQLTPEERTARVDALLKRYVDAEEELDNLAGAARDAAEAELSADYARMAAQEELPPLIDALEAKLGRGGDGIAYPMRRNKAGEWVRVNRPQTYYSGDLFDEMAGTLRGRRGEMMMTAEAAGEETASLLDLIGEYVRRGHRAKTERWEIQAGGRAFFKDTGEVRIGLTETELRAAIRGMKAEAAPGMPRGAGKAVVAREAAGIRRAEATVEELNQRIGLLLNEADRNVTLGRRTLPARFRVKGQERALPAAARLDEASRTLDAVRRDLQMATRRARTAEGRWGEATESRAPFPRERVARTQEKLITREVAGPDVGGPRALPPAPTRETPWQRAGLGPEAEAAAPAEAGVTPRVTRAEALRAKAVETRNRITVLEGEHARLVGRGQELGATAESLGRTPTRAETEALRAAARERATVPAQQRAQAEMDAAIDRIRRAWGDEYAGEVRQTMKQMQYEGMRRTVRELQTGALTKEQVQFYGRFHLRRGWEAYQNPEEWIAEKIKAQDPQLAAELNQIVANWQAMGRGAARGIPAGITVRRRALSGEMKEALGHLPVAERFRISQRIKSIAAAESYRMMQFRQRFALSGSAYKALPEVKKGLYTVVPEHPKFGLLASEPGTPQYIPKWLAAHLGMELPGAGWENTVARLMSWTLPAQAGEITGGKWGWYTDVVVRTWKFLHVPANLPTGFRNEYTNGLMTYVVGKVPPLLVPGYVRKGLLSTLREDGAYQLAMRVNPGFSHTLRRVELPNLARIAEAQGVRGVLARLTRGAAKGAEAASRTYELAELSSKMAVFLYHTERGMGAKQAAKLAVEAIFDYADVTRITNVLRRYGILPFVTFPLKATKALAKVAWEDPGRLAGAARATQLPQTMIPYQEQLEIETSLAPDERGRWIALPIQTKQGERVMLNIGYIVPWGPWGELSGIGLTLATIPRIVEDIARNESSFTQRELVNEYLPLRERVPAYLFYVAQSLAPSMVVRLPAQAIESRHPRTRMGAEPEEVSAGRTARTLAGGLLGLRTRAYVPEESMTWQGLDLRREQRGLTAELRKKGRRAATTGDWDEFNRRVAEIEAQKRQRADDYYKRQAAFERVRAAR